MRPVIVVVVVAGSYGESVVDEVSAIEDVDDVVFPLQLVSEQLPVAAVVVDAVISRPFNQILLD